MGLIMKLLQEYIYLRQHRKYQNPHQRNAQHDQILQAEGQGRVVFEKVSIDCSDKFSFKRIQSTAIWNCS